MLHFPPSNHRIAQLCLQQGQNESLRPAFLLPIPLQHTQSAADPRGPLDLHGRMLLGTPRVWVMSETELLASWGYSQELFQNHQLASQVFAGLLSGPLPSQLYSTQVRLTVPYRSASLWAIPTLLCVSLPPAPLFCALPCDLRGRRMCETVVSWWAKQAQCPFLTTHINLWLSLLSSF